MNVKRWLLALAVMTVMLTSVGCADKEYRAKHDTFVTRQEAINKRQEAIDKGQDKVLGDIVSKYADMQRKLDGSTAPTGTDVAHHRDAPHLDLGASTPKAGRCDTSACGCGTSKGKRGTPGPTGGGPAATCPPTCPSSGLTIPGSHIPVAGHSARVGSNGMPEDVKKNLERLGVWQKTTDERLGKVETGQEDLRGRVGRIEDHLKVGPASKPEPPTPAPKEPPAPKPAVDLKPIQKKS